MQRAPAHIHIIRHLADRRDLRLRPRKTPRTIHLLRAQGADAYLTKPLDVDEFLATIDRLLSAREAAA